VTKTETKTVTIISKRTVLCPACLSTVVERKGMMHPLLGRTASTKVQELLDQYPEAAKPLLPILEQLELLEDEMTSPLSGDWNYIDFMQALAREASARAEACRTRVAEEEAAGTRG